jgi:2-dehydropantoate 2-reductase
MGTQNTRRKKMRRISSVLIAGSGSIGSMVAWEIFRKDPDAVSVLAGGERLARYRERGFEINGELCRFPLTDAASRSSPDLVIIACKFHHLDQVLADLANHIGPDTLILSLLNGISSEGIIARAYGSHRVPYAMIVGTDAGHAGNRTAFTKTGTIFFGEPVPQLPGVRSPRVAAIAELFTRYGIQHEIPDDMPNRLWYKFMMNVGLNQLTAITRRPYALLKSPSRVPEAAALFEAAMREVMAVAAAEGITLTDADIESVYRTIDTLADGGKTSMCQDVEAGRKTEVELFAGTMIELGRKHGIPVPVNALFHQLIRAIEQSY